MRSCAPDTRLPSEAELAVQYGVARVTVRRAIALLRERGKVVTVHGRGGQALTQSARCGFSGRGCGHAFPPSSSAYR
jgi:DNA-binding GntR family transcriptional regulator